MSFDEGVHGDAATDSVTFAFADVHAERYGLARLGRSTGEDGAPRASALCVLFAGREPVAAVARGDLELAGGGWEDARAGELSMTIEAPLERWAVAFAGPDGQGFELEFAAAGEPVAAGPLGGLAGYEQPCAVTGTVRAAGTEARVTALGQRGHAWGDPDWKRIELARTVAAWTERSAATLGAVRPEGASNHAQEETWAAYWEPEGALPIEEGRLSTTYDAEGRTRRAGLELWPRDDEAWPRRAAGEVLCGSSLELGALRMDCSFFRWHLEGRTGVGRYDILRKAA